MQRLPVLLSHSSRSSPWRTSHFLLVIPPCFITSSNTVLTRTPPPPASTIITKTAMRTRSQEITALFGPPNTMLSCTQRCARSTSRLLPECYDTPRLPTFEANRLNNQPCLEWKWKEINQTGLGLQWNWKHGMHRLPPRYTPQDLMRELFMFPDIPLKYPLVKRCDNRFTQFRMHVKLNSGWDV
jgi:hypothetical protein